MSDDWNFRRVTRADFPLIASWLAQPEVERWWQHEWGPEAMERDFGPSVDGAEPNQDWLALLDGMPAGLIQRSLVTDYAENLADFAILSANPLKTPADRLGEIRVTATIKEGVTVFGGADGGVPLAR